LASSNPNDMETIIVQETNAAILDMLTVALQMENFEVFALTVADENFLELIGRVRPYVVLLNYEFTDHTCIRLCHRIKEKYPHLPLLALSCNHNINQEYNKYGFDGYIEKPFDLELLYRILREHIPEQKIK
jgi:DNA-binding response OmpR family regulator